MRQSGWRFAIKRAIDIVGSAVGLAVSSPFVGCAAVAIRLNLGRPILFRQVRPGRHGRLFTILKLRTMTDDRDADGALLPDGARLTSVGRLVRSVGIDELPQLWNVLCGDMSLVGPRPLLVQYLPLYSAAQARRHDVVPGLTGWAQVNGRNALAWPERFELDLWYVDNWSLRLDLAVLARTVLSVLRRSNISHDGHSTMPNFEGQR